MILGAVTSRVSEWSPLCGPTPEADVTLDDAFQLLRNSRRRHVVEYVADLEPDETVQLREVSIYIAALENDVEPDAVTGRQFKAVKNALYQTHLPKLTDADALEYDKRSGTLARGDATDSLKDLIATARRVFVADGDRR